MASDDDVRLDVTSRQVVPVELTFLRPQFLLHVGADAPRSIASGLRVYSSMLVLTLT